MKEEFTHHAKFYGIPCYWNDETNNIKGKNFVFDIVLTIAVWIEFEFPTNDDGFPVLIGKKLEDNNKIH